MHFVSVINEKTTGKPFKIDAGGVFDDAEMLIKAHQRRHDKPEFRQAVGYGQCW
jgi:hypothetical protein